MRRLPIFFVVDVSESMAGESLYKLEEGIATIVSTLRKDPYALEMAYLSVLAFAGKARTLTQLTELAAFYPPELPLGGGTALGAALNHLMSEIERTVVTTTHERKGDWRPIVFLLTDGHPTDNPAAAASHWNARYRDRTNLIAVSIGGGADHKFLRTLTDDLVVFNDAAPDAFSRFINWISMSIQSQSRSVSTDGDRRVSLAKADGDVIAPVTGTTRHAPLVGADDRFAVFVGRCARNRLPYVVKYERHMGRVETRDPHLSDLLRTRRYVLSTAVPVKNSYFDLTDPDAGAGRQTVSSDDLIGQPACPHCSARFGMAVCACGGIHCIEGDGHQTCPWCGGIGTYGSCADGDGFDIDRGLG